MDFLILLRIYSYYKDSYYSTDLLPAFKITKWQTKNFKLGIIDVNKCIVSAKVHTTVQLITHCGHLGALDTHSWWRTLDVYELQVKIHEPGKGSLCVCDFVCLVNNYETKLKLKCLHQHSACMDPYNRL